MQRTRHTMGSSQAKARYGLGGNGTKEFIKESGQDWWPIGRRNQ